MAELAGDLVRLRPASRADVPALARIRATPEVYEYWRGGDDLVAAVEQDLAEPGVRAYVIEHEGAVVGWIQCEAEEDPEYRHASIDVYLDPAVRGQGLGPDAVRTLARHLVAEHGHHRITIDPAARNTAAIRAYAKVGFKPVGVLRRYERAADGTWQDGLLMDLLADELTASAASTSIAEFPAPIGGTMEFVQIVEFSTSKIDEVQSALAEYRDKRTAAGAEMPLQVLECQDRDRANTFVAIVRFSSAEKAMENSDHPDTAAMAQHLMTLCDGPPTFRNLDLVSDTV